MKGGGTGKGRVSIPIGHGVSAPEGHAPSGKSLGALGAEGGGNPELRLGGLTWTHASKKSLAGRVTCARTANHHRWAGARALRRPREPPLRNSANGPRNLGRRGARHREGARLWSGGGPQRSISGDCLPKTQVPAKGKP